MADGSAFAIEEYKVLQEKMRNARDILNRLETVTMGGVIVASGILLGIGVTSHGAIPNVAWIGIIVIAISSGVRCWSYYVYVLRLQEYLMMIENYMRSADYKLPGFETFNRGKKLGPFVAVAFNIGIWILLIGGVSYLAIAHPTSLVPDCLFP